MQSAPVTVQADDLSEEFPDSDHDGAATDNPANSTHVCDLTTQPSSVITEEEAQMAVHLTEFFQEQRMVYERVNIIAMLVTCPLS